MIKSWKMRIYFCSTLLLFIFLLPLHSFAQELDFQKMIEPVQPNSKFTQKGYHVWCGSMIKGDDGKYYLFYSRWPDSLSHNNWVINSEIAIAVADSATGPYHFSRVALPKRDKKYWDADCTHNPTIHKFNGKYYLYYMGNYGNGEWWNHRNHQRIGVAVATNLLGPWKRNDKPLIDVSEKGYDSLMVSNPAVCEAPNHRYVMVYKSVSSGPMPFGGTVYHMVAFSDKPDGDFIKQPKPIFYKKDVKFAAEDPFIWYQNGKYWALLKDFKGEFTHQGLSIALFESADAINWVVSKNALAFKMEIPWTTGTQKVDRLERPQLYFENGVPKILFAAVSVDNKTFNVAMPLKAR